MRPEDRIDAIIPDIVEGLARCAQCPEQPDGRQDPALREIPLSGQKAVHAVLERLIAVFFPSFQDRPGIPRRLMADHLRYELKQIALELTEQTQRAVQYQCAHDQCRECDDCHARAADAVARLIDALRNIQCLLHSDIIAAYEGDPAARSNMEVIMSYPGIFAIAVHRIAHVLYRAEVPLIPRIMSEYAHSNTGIDIHPGATIGRGFFIDHGTGVVIGETCTIGEHVKIYQGVTLGALSFKKDADGRLVKGTKRHPNVENNVVIYAGATILGGDTTIGHHSVIGGNVWLTHSVPPYSKVLNQQPSPLIKSKDGTWEKAKGDWNDFGAGI